MPTRCLDDALAMPRWCLDTSVLQYQESDGDCSTNDGLFFIENSPSIILIHETGSIFCMYKHRRFHCTVYIVQRTVYSVQRTVYNVLYIVYNVHCTHNNTYVIHYTCRPYNIDSTLYIVHCTSYTVHYTLYIVHCTL